MCRYTAITASRINTVCVHTHTILLLGFGSPTGQDRSHRWKRWQVFSPVFLRVIFSSPWSRCFLQISECLVFRPPVCVTLQRGWFPNLLWLAVTRELVAKVNVMYRLKKNEDFPPSLVCRFTSYNLQGNKCLVLLRGWCVCVFVRSLLEEAIKWSSEAL